MPVSQRTPLRRAEFYGLANGINDNKVIARAMHFGKGQLHHAA
jgi:hypothetical protein